MSLNALHRFIAFILFNSLYYTTSAQLIVNTSISATDLVNNVLLGPGVYAFNIQYTGSPVASGYFDGSQSNIGLSNGVLLTTGKATDAIGPNYTTDQSFVNNAPGDAALDSIFSQTTMEAASLEFDFVPSSDTVRFHYVFASEEFTEGVCTPYNDLFGFYISGPGIPGVQNIALIPNTSIPVSISSINSGIIGSAIFQPDSTLPYCYLYNTSYYINNSHPGGLSVQYDGWTVVLEAKSAVIPCETYHIKMVVAEANDPTYDTGVFIEGGSFNSQYITVSAEPEYIGAMVDSALVEGCGRAIVHFERFDDLSSSRTLNYTLSGSADAGIDYDVSAAQIYFPPGANKVDLTITPVSDHVNETQEEVIVNLIPDFIVCSIFDPPQCKIRLTDPSTNITVTVSNDTTITCGGNTLLLTAKATGGTGNYYNYEWNWNGQSSGGDSLLSAPEGFTTYYVIASDTCGNSATAEVEVHCSIYIPDAFTPNNDGKNDNFVIPNIYGCSLKIFSRWGEVVYSSDDYDNSWNGGDLPQGVYLYYVKMKDDTKYTGHLTLLR